MESEELKQECMERMKLLELNKQVVEDFKNNNIIYVSQIQGNLEKANDEQMKQIKELEEKRNIKIYHIIYKKEENTEILCFQYVGNNKHEWVAEKSDIMLGYDGIVFYYIEKGTREIGVKVENGKILEIVI